MFRSATFKLTMWYLAIVMAISLSFSAVLYHVAAGELQRGLNRATLRIDRAFPVFNNSPLLQPDTDYSNGTHRLLFRLVSLNIIVLVGAGAASYWLARRTLEPIEAAHEQQKRFTADVSHELRTPLTALRMESEVALLNSKTSASELRGTLQSNLEEIGKLEVLINNLLRLTQLEADELQQAFKPLNIHSVVTQAVEQVAPIAKLHKIQVSSDVPAATLTGDHDSLVQLVVILLDNAIKYSPHGTAVQVQSQEQDGELQLVIIDHGKGIAPKALQHVF
ncbi:MAG TPA: HAMP domain-containing sensor histidine kinase, partial [Candidatus Saccharimonadales bacterium]|nr:HAMP domain-containing sensor histidine kinase [Candidatus Saccharimonadales bacterium]